MKVKVINLKDKKRLIYGELLNDIDIDFTQSLSEIKNDLEFVIPIFVEIYKSKERFAFPYNRTIKRYARVHQGSHHLDIVDDGIGSLNWLHVEDHAV